MRTVVCIGGGRFGAQAAREAANGGDRVLVIDHDGRCLGRGIATAVTEDPESILDAVDGQVLFLKAEGTAALLDILETMTPELVVPAASGHLAALLAVEHCRRRGAVIAPALDLLPPFLRRLPIGSVHSSSAVNGVVVTSYMSDRGICPEGCEQPPKCPVTKRTNEVPMHEGIREALTAVVDRPLVLTTSSLGKVGGLPGGELRSMLFELDASRSGMTWGVATACRCHGITNLMRVV